MAELKTWDGDRWVTLADMDVTPELAALAERGEALSPAEFMYAVLESSRHKPRSMVCRYCANPVVILNLPHTVDGPAIYCGSLTCHAAWNDDGTPRTDPKGTRIDA